MNTLVLEWVENDGGRTQTRTQTIDLTSVTKNRGTFRIGRDRNQCDLVTSNNTVSRLHIEILFSQPQQSFFLRNLAPNNSPMVDGQPVTQGEVPLRTGSIITLGQVTLNVTSVSSEEENSPTVVVAPSYPPQQRRGNSPQPRNSYPPVQQQPVSPQPVHQHQAQPPVHYHQPQPIPHQHQHVPAGSASGLECPRCHKVSDYSHLDIGCPWCGTSLAAAVSILVTPKRP
ncbi:FHA domain-containing protein [Merismopedia glauca]|uniref:Peptide-binding protein n=1 Tax=Merismopedia glauca CCAP 1448/3 TaxID=1296344 RepID=A0A2T1BXT8_9CYAN|nr:FHA domain-containing protein [Merismopedia glauca]PSB00727.1 peptide-binding protein [Merismopedia glauca CCAP 1448/3]